MVHMWEGCAQETVQTGIISARCCFSLLMHVCVVMDAIEKFLINLNLDFFTNQVKCNLWEEFITEDKKLEEN